MAYPKVASPPASTTRFRLLTTTRAPCRASARQKERPSPRPPPETTATRPASGLSPSRAAVMMRRARRSRPLAMTEPTIRARGTTPIRFAAPWLPISTSAAASASAGDVPTVCRVPNLPGLRMGG